jgi:hypothetical protein
MAEAEVGVEGIKKGAEVHREAAARAEIGNN